MSPAAWILTIGGLAAGIGWCVFYWRLMRAVEGTPEHD